MKLTKFQAIVITGYTGMLASSFSTFHKDVEERLGYSVFTHQFGDKEFSESIKELYKEDFINICFEGGIK